MNQLLRRVRRLLVDEDELVHLLRNPVKKSTSQTMTECQRLSLESKVGGQLFGPIPEGFSREFFCLDDHTWIWQEVSYDDFGDKVISKMRYQITVAGVIKTSGQDSYFIEGEELANFIRATSLYYQEVSRQVYRRDPLTGQKLYN